MATVAETSGDVMTLSSHQYLLLLLLLLLLSLR